MYVFGKSLCRSDYFQFLALYHLIADAPAEYGGVVAVAKHHRFNITFPPLVKKHGIVMFVLGITPSVKSLVDNEQSLTIALCEVRTALKPASFNNRTLRASAASKEHAPNMPLS